MEDNEIQKNVTQKFQSYHQDKKISKFSDYRIQKQFKEEDMKLVARFIDEALRK